MQDASWLQQRAEAIVQRGADVRREIARVVVAGAAGIGEVADGFIGIARSVVSGAARGASKVYGEEKSDTLRAVVDGLGDGLATTAQAAQLTLQEAAGGASSFAREDLDKLDRDLRSVRDGFVDAIASEVSRAGGHIATQADAVRQHASVALRRALPALQSALEAAARNPLGLASQALQTGASAARGGLSGLFSALGSRLQRLGERVAPFVDPDGPRS